jgi:glycosyltransferase involved in cell wall biosynthesis
MTGPVLFCGAWDEGPGYPRARSLRQGLQLNGTAVAECRLPGPGAGKRKGVASLWRWPWLLVRQLATRLRLQGMLRRTLPGLAPSAILVPYPGHWLVSAVKRSTRLPVVLDLFLSAYDTAVLDRALFAEGSLAARLLKRLDTNACRSADLVLVDTEENAHFLHQLTGLPEERFAAVQVGDPDAPAAPAPYVGPAADAPLELLFFGTGVPLHGLPILLEALALAGNVRLTLVGGTAADREDARALLGPRLDLQPEFVDRDRLQQLLDRAQLVAGVFSTSAKAARVVPFKVVHALASGRPVITADTPALRRQLDGSEAVFTVPAGNAQALAAELERLHAQPDRLAAAAAGSRALYDRQFAVQRSGAHLQQLLADLAARGAP